MDRFFSAVEKKSATFTLNLITVRLSFYVEARFCVVFKLTRFSITYPQIPFGRKVCRVGLMLTKMCVRTIYSDTIVRWVARLPTIQSCSVTLFPKAVGFLSAIHPRYTGLSFQVLM